MISTGGINDVGPRRDNGMRPRPRGIAMTRLCCACLLIASLMTITAAAARPAPPTRQHVSRPTMALAGRVTDAAGILSPAFRATLAAKLDRFERATHHQLVVVTVSSLGGRDVADFTRDLANDWGIGRKRENDGIVLLVAPNQRKLRIAVGRGLEQKLTEPVCRRIIDVAIVPRFGVGDYAGGIDRGTDALIARLS